MENYNNNKGTSTDLDGPANNNYASTNVIYINIGSTDDNYERENSPNICIKNNKQETPTRIETTDAQLTLQAPSNTSYSSPTIAYQLQQGTPPPPRALAPTLATWTP